MGVGGGEAGTAGEGGAGLWVGKSRSAVSVNEAGGALVGNVAAGGGRSGLGGGGWVVLGLLLLMVSCCWGWC
jgi:hypothetical protein